MHRLAAIRARREEIRELRTLFAEQKVAILKPFLGAEDAGANSIARFNFLSVQVNSLTNKSTTDESIAYRFKKGVIGGSANALPP